MKNKLKDIPYCGVREQKIKEAKPVLDESTLRRLYAFINRRYQIHLKKDVLKQPAPWTKDEVLRDFRFTNIRREHDRETRWVIEHITKNPTLCYEDKLINCILFRLYNKHETLELIGAPFKLSSDWKAEKFREVFKKALREDKSRVFFTAAFHTVGMKQGLQKATGEPFAPMRVLKFIETALHQYDIGSHLSSAELSTPEAYFNYLSSFTGIGSFLAYQIFVDFTYIEEFPFSENEFTVAGPGCIKGLNYLFKDRDGMTYEECLFWLRDNLDSLFQEVNPAWYAPALFWDLPEEDRCFNVMSLENCFCELSKYIRALDGTGRPRKRYKACTK